METTISSETRPKLEVISQTAISDLATQSVLFTIQFNRTPNFLSTDEFGRQADNFQYHIDVEGELSGFGLDIDYSKLDTIIRNSTINNPGNIDVRAAFPPDYSDPNSGGWGAIRGSVPYNINNTTVSFSVLWQFIGETDGQFSYSLRILEFGGTTQFLSNRLSLPPRTFSHLPEFNVGSLFDPAFYLHQNPDVAAAVNRGDFQNAFEHFNKFGFAEGRFPNSFFANYLAEYPDVGTAVARGWFKNGLSHFISHGLFEGRSPAAGLLPFLTFYLARNPDIPPAIKQGGSRQGLEYLLRFGGTATREYATRYNVLSQLFDPNFYLAMNEDVANALDRNSFRTFNSVWEHFVQYGMWEGRDPSLGFSNSFYLSQNPDVAKAVSQGLFRSGLEHFIKYGVSEERMIAESTAPDVRASKTVIGGAGNDILTGGLGNDLLTGAAGNDLLDGSFGNDIVTGEDGRDLFVLTPGSGLDTIADFDRTQDSIGLAGGLTWNQLAITQGGGTFASDTLIRIAATGDLFAIVSGVSASSLTDAVFVVV